MKAVAAVILSIAIPLTATSIGLDANVLAIGGGIAMTIGFALLGYSFERFRTTMHNIYGLFARAFTQSLTASFLTLIFGIAMALTWSSNFFPRLFFGGAALASAIWWLHALTKTKIVSQQREIRALEQELQELKRQVAVLAPAGAENDRLRGVVQHVINVLVSLEEAKEGRIGVDEIGPAAWIEHRCLRSTRDVLARAAGRGDYRIELGILRVPNEVVYIDMAAGDLLKRYQEQGGCPLGRAPDQEAIEEILQRKETEGGFADSLAVEFELHGEPHFMAALSTAEFDEVDSDMLALIGAMFVVLKLSLQA